LKFLIRGGSMELDTFFAIAAASVMVVERAEP